MVNLILIPVNIASAIFHLAFPPSQETNLELLQEKLSYLQDCYQKERENKSLESHIDPYAARRIKDAFEMAEDLMQKGFKLFKIENIDDQDFSSNLAKNCLGYDKNYFYWALVKINSFFRDRKIVNPYVVVGLSSDRETFIYSQYVDQHIQKALLETYV